MEYILGPRENARITPTNGLAVRLSDDARKCVVFLGLEIVGTDGVSDVDPLGTGFFVAAGPDADSGTYLVTAKHVARQLSSIPFGIRLNERDGGVRIISVDIATWHEHPSADVAATPYNPPAWADVLRFPVKSFATPFKMETKNFGAGDLIYVVGLFALLKGSRRNLPIVHTGSIALLPEDEPIPVRDRNTEERLLTTGYLVEAQAIGGASGSPVFVRRTIKHVVPDPQAPGNVLKAWTAGSLWLLGMWQGSWTGDPDEIRIVENKAIRQVVPYGMGIVVPAQAIIEVINTPELKSARDAAERRILDGLAATLDSH